ncbi:SDR family NAD(P)-dependent oxidoreductase [Streptomyces sp. NPDC048436]|uniref:type I polyketide synthase n=1 Tax=Streptomyces sp. NPDC048436 TaxID=3365550 RepID=UPI0037249141
MSEAHPGGQPAVRRIAVIGLAGRFPGAQDVDQLWTNLVDGVESLTELTDEQLRRSDISEESIASPHYIRRRPLMDDVEGFDAGFFGYRPREADITDPQQRVFLEVCHTALQHAGYDPARHEGAIGVYGGSGPVAYHFRNVYENSRVRAAVGDMAIETNNNLDYLATHVAHALGLEGPAVSMVTACSTSLVAIHSACQALASGDCDMAVAGGVNILLPYYGGQKWAENSIYALDGHVRVFDAEAAGTNFGTGAGAVVLKRYEDAVADGDHIEAVLIGTAVNNDGARRNGFAAPSHDGQAEVITQALAAAGGLSPDTIGYVEAHGTATAVGDPIEVSALSTAYRRAGATRNQACPIGSLKANIGHLGPAAGVAGLIKTVLSMQHDVIPPAINFTTPNPRIGFPETPFYVNAELSPWPERGNPKRAGVSSFGIGGTNAHVIVEEAPRPHPRAAERDLTPQVLPLSARTETALATLRTELAAHLRDHPELALEDVAHTLQTGRREMTHRAAFACRDTERAIAALERENHPRAQSAQHARPAFLFPGQGSQQVGMAAGLYEAEPLFRAIVDECAEILREHLGQDLRPLLCGTGEEGTAEDAAERLNRTELAQPALFVTEYALARLWMDRGVEPAALVGHSIGEYTAACLAGVFTLHDALHLVAERGRLIGSMPRGAMLAVPLPEDDLAPLLTDELSLAAVNSPKSCVVSGPEDALEVLGDWLASHGIRGQRLQTSHAFHSAMLDPVLEPFREAVAAADLRPPRIPFVSTLTGTWITDEEATDPDYWATQLRGTVRFAQACGTVTEKATALLETGPGQSLTTLARQTLSRDTAVVPSMRRANSERSDEDCVAEAVAALWSHGVGVDWARLRSDAPRRRVVLPTYPYERVRHWIDPDPDPEVTAPAAAEPLVLPADESTFLPTWRRRPLNRAAPASEWADGGYWLVLEDSAGTADTLIDGLAGRGVPLVRVVAGEAFADLGGGRYTMDPARRADHDALLSALDAGPGRPTHVLHGWSAAPAAAGAFGTDETDRVRDTGFLGLLHLSQALLERWPDGETDVRVLTTGSSDVSGSDPVEPAKALLLGPCLVIPHESPTLTFQLIDADAAALADAGQLAEELGTPVRDPLVAYRAGRRWVSEHEAVALPQRSVLPRTLRRRGVYLITGGMGGIGLETAKELARTAGARLVLVNRAVLPERSEWDAHLAAHGPDERTSRRILGVREVEELGGEVLVACADVTDEAAMRKVVDIAKERFGRIHGVFHAAGVPGGGLAALRTEEQAREVLAPKVDGTLVLDRLLGDELELLVLFSSIVSVSGDYGMVDYCSANAFLDAYAQARRTRGRCRTIAVNWCGWTEVGMIGDTHTNAPRAFRELEQGITSTQAAHPLLGRRQDTGDDSEVVYSALVDPDFHWVLTDHRMGGSAVFPGTSFIELMSAAYKDGVDDGPVEVRDVLFSRPLAVDQRREVQVRGQRAGSGAYDFTVRSRAVDTPEAPWHHHARATVARYAGSAEPEQRDLAGIRARCDELSWSPQPDTDEHLVQFGPHWPAMEVFDVGRGEHLVTLGLREGQGDDDLGDFVVHPSLLDGATSLSLFIPGLVGGGTSFLPVGFDRLVVREPLPARLYSHVRSFEVAQDRSSATHDIGILDERGREVVTVEGFKVRILQVEELGGGHGPAASPGSDRETLRADPAASTVSTAAAAAAAEPDGTPSGELLITPDEGISLLWRVLDTRDEAQYVVSREPLAQRLRRVSRMAESIGAAGSGALAGAARRTEQASVAVTETATTTQGRLVELWQDAFGLPRIGLDEDFFDLGGNSLVAVQLAVRIRESLGVSLPGVAVLEYPTVRDLARRVEEALQQLDGAQKR